MQCFQPTQPLLRPYVKQIHYFTLDASNLLGMTAIPPGNLFFSLVWGDGTFSMQRPKTGEKTNLKGVCISGQQFEIAHHWADGGAVHIIGFELTPHAIYQFFGVPQQETTQQVLCLDDLWSSKINNLYEQVLNTADPIAQIALVEHFLCQRILSKEWKDEQIIDEAIHKVGQTHGSISIDKLSSHLGVTTRTLQRYFLQSLGVSPKAYCKIIQFNNAFRQLALYRKHILDVVADSGYYDQAHFIHSFRKIFGISPGQFLDRQEEILHFLSHEDPLPASTVLSEELRRVRKLYVF